MRLTCVLTVSSPTTNCAAISWLDRRAATSRSTSVSRGVSGTALYLALIALLSLGVGALIRDTAVTLTAVFALLFVVPVVTEFVSDPTWHERLQKWSPTTAGQSIQNTLRLDELPIAPWPGLGVLALWAAGAAAAGYILFARRDA